MFRAGSCRGNRSLTGCGKAASAFSRPLLRLVARAFGTLAAAVLPALLLAAFLSSAALAAGPEGRRAALVIGNSAYDSLPRLPNAVNDARHVADVLARANFEVTVGADLSKAGLEKTIREFLRSLDDGDVALFYYSGHAV